MDRKELLSKCYEYCISETLNMDNPLAENMMTEFSETVVTNIPQHLRPVKDTQEYFDTVLSVKNDLVLIANFFMRVGMDTASLLLQGVAPFDMV